MADAIAFVLRSFLAKDGEMTGGVLCLEELYFFWALIFKVIIVYFSVILVRFLSSSTPIEDPEI